MVASVIGVNSRFHRHVARSIYFAFINTSLANWRPRIVCNLLADSVLIVPGALLSNNRSARLTRFASKRIAGGNRSWFNHNNIICKVVNDAAR